MGRGGGGSRTTVAETRLACPIHKRTTLTEWLTDNSNNKITSLTTIIFIIKEIICTEVNNL